MRKIIIFLLLCSSAFSQNAYRIYNSFNAGELGLLNAREDLAKFQTGLSIMENLFPIPQGGAQKRPGTKYIAEVKTSSLATRILPFEFSTSQSFAIEAGNQYLRFFTSGAQILEGVGTEDSTILDAAGTVVSHWSLNDDDASTTVVDDKAVHTTTASSNTETIHDTGQVGTGSFDLDTTDAVTIAHAATLSFTDDSDDEDFSISAWVHVADTQLIQVIFSKWKEDTAGEYRFSLDANRKLEFRLRDDSESLSANAVAHWKLDEDAANTEVHDDTTGGAYPDPQDGVSTANTSTLNDTGIVGDCFDFAGTQAVKVADHADLSFGNSTVDSPMSICAWIYITAASVDDHIVAKWDTNAKREWSLRTNSSNHLRFQLADQSVSKNPYRETDDALSDGWHFVVAVYAGQSTTGATAANFITLYVDGTLAASTATNQATYDAMENLGGKLSIGSRLVADTPADIWPDKIDNAMLFDVVLSAASIDSLYNGGNGTAELAVSSPFVLSDDALALGWKFVAVTYDGDGLGNVAASRMTLYASGVAIDSTATEDENYVAMEDNANAAHIGSQIDSAAALQHIWADKIDNVTLFSTTLSAANVASLYSTTPYEIETPYLTADLFDLKYEQSADVLYITHPDYETRKLSRQATDIWTIIPIDIQTGPFRTQNSDVADFISSSGTTGTVTLTATGHTPFITGVTAGHEPSGSISTSKSQTGALFKLVHPLDTLSFKDTLEDDFAAGQVEGTSWMGCGTLYKGAGWTWVTGGTWLGTVKIQRNYTIGAAVGNGADEGASVGWETVFPFDGVTTARNVSTSGTEDDGDADYRVIFADDTSGTVESYFTTDQTEIEGIVEITTVTSSTSAIGTVVKTLASTDTTYKWAEGSWSNYRGWPQTVTFFEDRLFFGGNIAQPDTIWGSVTSDYENMDAGVDDDDAVVFTLSSRQVNVIEWLVGKDKLLIGTSGAEWTIAGGTDEPLTPSNVIAKQHSTYGSANLQANLANESVLFFQRGKEKMRELAYNWELDSYVAPDMTILSNLVTDSGIDDTAFQKIPDSILWCVRNDGELPVFSYERAENITAWSRLITQTNLAGTLTDSDFESVARISGSPEDEVWVVVERVVDSNTVRYIEQFQPRDFGSDPCDAFYIDSGVTYDSTASSAMTGLGHLEGQTVYVLADGVVFDTSVVIGGAITLKLATVTTTASTVQMGLGYEVNMRTMPLSILGGETIHGKQKRISEVIAEWYISGDFSIGKDADTLQTYSISGQTTDLDRKTFPPGYDRNGYIFVYQQSPEPLTLLSIMAEFNLK